MVDSADVVDIFLQKVREINQLELYGAEFLKKDVEYVGKRRYLLAYQKPIRHLTAYPFPKFCATYEL